jgi:hypothetical protein
MVGGERFQARVTAWWAARILLETPIGASFSLAPMAVAEYLAPEAGDEIDDVRVDLATPAGTAHIYGQCKRALSLGRAIDGKWAEVLRQFARQQVADNATDAATSHITAPERRYVLFYEGDNGSLHRLRTVLDRYRSLPDGATILEAALNKAERAITAHLSRLLDLLSAAHSGEDTALAFGAGRNTLLRRICVVQLRLADGVGDTLTVLDGIRHLLLADPQDAIHAMNCLRILADDLMADRHPCNRTALCNRLNGAGVVLKTAPSFAADFRKMIALTNDELAAHEEQGRRRVRVGAREFVIERPQLWDRVEGSDTSSVLVTGEAGVGKTGVLMDVARRLCARGTRVWYWAADELPDTSLAAMQSHLRLEHPWPALLGEAHATGGVVLIIDGLDGLRDVGAQQAYQKLIAIAHKARARVIASIRSFDLQFADQVQQLFPADPESGTVRVLGGASHGRPVNAVVIGDLDVAELDRVAAALPMVQRALDIAPSLRELVRNLFNLDLLCQLLDTGEDAAGLSSIATRAALFERYWQRRILSRTDRNALVAALTATVSQMVEERRLQVSPPPEHATALDALRSMSVLRTPAAFHGSAPFESRVEFAHHVLFDHAAERLFVRQRRDILGSELTPDNQWPLMLRPSLVLFFRYLWTNARSDFWDTLLAVEHAHATGLHRFAAYTVIAEEASARVDFDPLFAGIAGPDATHWQRVIRGVIVVAPFTALPGLFAKASGAWWLTFANDLIASDDHDLAYLGRRVLFTAADHLAMLAENALRTFNTASIALARVQRMKETPSLSLRPAIEWVCRSIGVNRKAAATFLRELLTPDEVARSGYVVLGALAEHIGDLAAQDAALARDVYVAAYSYREESKADTPMGGIILSMRSNRRQDYDLALHRLGEAFPALFRSSPTEGTLAAIAVMRYIATRGGEVLVERLPVDQLSFAGQPRPVLDDRIHRWHAQVWREQAAMQVVNAWEAGMVELGREATIASVGGNQEIAEFDGVWQVLCDNNEFTGLWGRLLTAAAQAPEFYASRLWRLLLEPALLARKSTVEAAGAALRAFARVLEPGRVSEIEAAVLRLAAGADDHIRGRADPSRVKPYLLSRIPAHRRSVRAVDLLAQSRDVGEAPSDEPVVHVGNRRVTTESWLEDAGVDVTRPVHTALLEDIAILDALSTESARDEDTDAAMTTINRVEARIAAPDNDVDNRVADAARATILRSTSALALSSVPLAEATVEELASRFASALSVPPEVANEERGRQFDNIAAWGADEDRVNAARGVVGLALRTDGFASRETDLHRLIADPEPQVRLQLASHLWQFFEVAPTFVWAVLESWVKSLPQAGYAGVMKFALSGGWFWWLRHRDEARAERLLEALLSSAHANGNRELREQIARYFGVLCFAYDPEWTRGCRARMLGDSAAWSDELHGVLREAITRVWPREGSVQEDGEPDATPRARALAIEILLTVAGRLTRYDEEHRALPVDKRSAEHATWVTTQASASHVASAEFRIASIAWVRALAAPDELAGLSELNDGGAAPDEDADDGGASVTRAPPTVEELAAWLDASIPLLEAVLAFPQAASAYDLVEGCDALARVIPIPTLRLLRQVTEMSAKTGLTTDGMAADRTIEILAHVLAKDNGALASDTRARVDYLRVLEAYLDAGWPKAIDLALRIETIFRAASNE